MSDKPANISSNASPQPGQLLKDGREKLGLTQKEIATQLNLQVETIDAVEKDDAARLPTPTYVRGYIRSYARIVRLDGDMLIRLYEQDAAAPPEIIPDKKQLSQMSSHDRPVRAASYMITFVLALLLLAWLQSNYIVNENPSADEPAHTAAGTENQNAGAAVLETYDDTPDPVPAAPVQTPSDDLPDKIINTMEAPATLSLDTTVNTESLSTGAAVSGISSQEDRVSFKLNKNSWIEIYDANNNKLYMNLAKAGEEIHLTGTSPFNVLLGYSPGVDVTFNDEPFNAEPFSNAGIARFKLEKSDHPE